MPDALSKLPKLQLFQIALSSCLDDLMLEIRNSWARDPEIQLLIGHLKQGTGTKGKFS